MRHSLFPLLLMALAAGCASVTPRVGEPAARPAVDAGPLAAVDATLGGVDRVRAAGPIYESQVATNGLRFLAVRPFFSSVDDPEHARTRQEYLWPLASAYTWNRDSSWRCLLAFGADRDNTDNKSRERFWIIPFVFYGQDDDGGNYFALFPLGGCLHHFVGRDRITFALWPLYSQTKVHDLEAHHILWPFVSWMRGEGEHGFRVFPFYGESVNEGRVSKRFVLWPFWTSAEYDYPTEKGSAHVLFPLYGRVHTSRQDGWMALPPFFRWSKGPELTQANLPWPFIQYSRGTVDKFYLWPIIGRRTLGHTHKSFFLWPICRHEVLTRATGEYRRVHILPFLYADSTRVPSAAGAATDGNPSAAAAAAEGGTNAVAAAGMPGEVFSRYFKFWPLISYRREGDARSLNALALWPVKQSGPIERNWAPLWTLYSRKSQGRARETEVLWGLWRQRRGTDGSAHLGLFPIFTRDRAGDAAGRRGWSVLGGLLARDREGLITRTRLLYVITFKSGVPDEIRLPADGPAAGTDVTQP